MTEDDERHGTVNGYVNLGCRCVECRAANTARMAEGIARRKAALSVDDPRHGLNSTYCNHGCRCGFCRAAHTAHRGDYRRRKAAEV